MSNCASNWIICICFYFSVCKNHNLRQLCQQIVRPVINTCFCFTNCKYCIARAATLLGQSYLPVFGFLLLKFITQGQLCQQLARLIKPIAHTCFCCSLCKNQNTRVVELAANAQVADMPVANMPSVSILTVDKQEVLVDKNWLQSSS